MDLSENDCIQLYPWKSSKEEVCVFFLVTTVTSRNSPCAGAGVVDKDEVMRHRTRARFYEHAEMISSME